MVSSAFSNFFLAATGAGAALIGLLFVAISVKPGLTDSRATRLDVQVSISMAFTALVNGFFISFIALLPHIGIGDVAIFMGAVSGWSCLTSAYSLVKQERRSPGWRSRGAWRRLARGLMLVVIGAIIYGWEIVMGLQAIQHPGDIGPVWTIANLVIGVFGLGLVRAWELLGARSGSGLIRWLSPLEASSESTPTAEEPDRAQSIAGAKPAGEAERQR